MLKFKLATSFVCIPTQYSDMNLFIEVLLKMMNAASAPVRSQLEVFFLDNIYNVAANAVRRGQ